MAEATANDYAGTLTAPLPATAGAGATVAVTPAAPTALVGQDTHLRVGNEIVTVTVSAPTAWTIKAREAEDAERWPKQDWPAGTAVDVVLTAGQLAGMIAAAGGSTATAGFWTYKTTTTMADPGGGNVRGNQAAFGTSTQLAVAALSATGTDRSQVLRSLVAGDTVYVQQQDDAGNWVRFALTAAPTDNSTYFLLAVTTVTGSGTTPGNNAGLLVQFEHGQANVARLDLAQHWTAQQTFEQPTSFWGTVTVDGSDLRVINGGNIRCIGGAFYGDGSGLTNLPAPTLPANVALKDAANVFTRNQEIAFDPAAGSPGLSVYSTTTAFTTVLSVSSSTGVILTVQANSGGQNVVTASGVTRTVAAATTQVPLTTVGQAGATANLQEWKTGTTVVASVGPDGKFHGDGSALTGITGGGGATAPLTLTSTATGMVPLTVVGFAGQTASLSEWRTSGGTVYAAVNASPPLLVVGDPAADLGGDLQRWYRAGPNYARVSKFLDFVNLRSLYVGVNPADTVGPRMGLEGEFWFYLSGSQKAIFGCATGAGGIFNDTATGDVAFRASTGQAVHFGVNVESKLKIAVGSDSKGTKATLQGVTTTQTRPMLDVNTTFINATDASRTSRIQFSAYDTIAREFLRVDTTGGGPNIAMGGSAVSTVTLIVHNQAQTYVGLAVRAAGSQSADIQQWQDSTGTVLGRVNKDGHRVIKKTSAPADADLNASEVALWLDATPGSTKLMIKAKDSSGTVRTGSVALT